RLSRLSKKAERDGAYRVAKRLRAVVLNSQGRTSGELADILQAPRSKVSEWLARFEVHGVQGLLEGYRSGRPRSLSGQQRERLSDILDSGRWLMGWTPESGLRPSSLGSSRSSSVWIIIPDM